MKLSGREDIDAPIAQVWSAVTDFDALELLALRRGVEVTRTGVVPAISWKTAFTLRGKRRQLQIRLQRLERPTHLAASFTSTPVEGSGLMELIELGPNRTRMMITVEVKPRTLAARIMLQSLKLARGRVNKRFNQRLSQLARMIESRLSSQNA